jgi:hypothetical protein
MTTQKSEKKMDIWAKEKQPKKAKSKKPDGHLSKRKIIYYPGLVISLRLGFRRNFLSVSSSYNKIQTENFF